MLIRESRFLRWLYRHHRSRTPVVQSSRYGFHDCGQTFAGRQATTVQCRPCIGLEPSDDPLRPYDYGRWRRNQNGVEMYGPCPHCIQKLWSGDQSSVQLPWWYCLARAPYRPLGRSQQRQDRTFRRCGYDIWTCGVLKMKIFIIAKKIWVLL